MDALYVKLLFNVQYVTVFLTVFYQLIYMNGRYRYMTTDRIGLSPLAWIRSKAGQLCIYYLLQANYFFDPLYILAVF